MKLPRYQYDEDNGVIYKLTGDYYYPEVFTSVEEKELSLSLEGQARLTHMKEHEPGFYAELAEKGELQAYLSGFTRELREEAALIARQMGGDAYAAACAREIAFAHAFEGRDTDG